MLRLMVDMNSILGEFGLLSIQMGGPESACKTRGLRNSKSKIKKAGRLIDGPGVNLAGDATLVGTQPPRIKRCLTMSIPACVVYPRRVDDAGPLTG